LRTILDDALDRIKAEVFGTADASGPDGAPGTGDHDDEDHVDRDRNHGDHDREDLDHRDRSHGDPR
jgi:hypothetical protein